MRLMRTWTWMAAAFAVGAIACSGGDSNPADLAGTWTASKMQFVSSTYGTVDLVAQGGSATLVLDANKTYTTTVRVPGQSDQVATGTWDASSDVLTLTESPTSNMQFDYVLSGSTLTLTGADAPFDFNGDGVEEEAKLNVTASR